MIRENKVLPGRIPVTYREQTVVGLGRISQLLKVEENKLAELGIYADVG